ncbi:MAG TPA: hypothetical protein VHB46_13630 [Burkholderiales bacterium]|nr:hypothetical protein [Burkholderiales bacterium]
MPLLHNYVTDQVLMPVLFLFLLVMGLFGVAFGVGLVVMRTRVFQLLGPMNRWVSMRKTLAPMEVHRDIEPFVHKHRRLFGAIFILGGLLTIVVLSAKVDPRAVTTAFGARNYVSFAPYVVQGVTTFLIVGSLVAIVTGVVLAFFPGMLAMVETRSNHWYSSRQMAKGVDSMHLPLDRWFESSPRAAGAVLGIAALVLVVLSILILRRYF